MNNGARMQDVLTLPLTGIAGFLMVRHIATLIDARDSKLRRLLVFIGDNTIVIFVFHIIAFKAVSLVKIAWYGLPFGQIGCHMVIHDYNGDLFWILYSVAGVAIPLLWLTAWRRLSARIRTASLISRIKTSDQ